MTISTFFTFKEWQPTSLSDGGWVDGRDSWDIRNGKVDISTETTEWKGLRREKVIWEFLDKIILTFSDLNLRTSLKSKLTIIQKLRQISRDSTAEVWPTCLMVRATRLSRTGPRSSCRRWTSSRMRRRTIWERATSPTLFLVTTSHFSGVVTNIWKTHMETLELDSAGLTAHL